MNKQNVFDTECPWSEFGLPHEGGVLGFNRANSNVYNNSFIPPKDPRYIFPIEQLGIMSAWWEAASDEPLFISGPHGSGKTSFVNQFCARVNAPVVSLTARSRLDRNDLIGHYIIDKDRSMKFVDGPLTRAWRNGFVFLVNEMSASPADLWLSVNELLEGAPLCVEATGEVIKRHPRARIVMTDNIRGLTDDGCGRYLGRHIQDPAVLDRCWKMRMEYMDADSEINLLMSHIPNIRTYGIDQAEWKRSFATRLRSAADRVRAAYSGESCPEPIEATLSTRVLLRLMHLLLVSSKDASRSLRENLRKALRIAVTDSIDAASAMTIEKLVEAELGDICHYLKSSSSVS